MMLLRCTISSFLVCCDCLFGLILVWFSLFLFFCFVLFVDWLLVVFFLPVFW